MKAISTSTGISRLDTEEYYDTAIRTLSDNSNIELYSNISTKEHLVLFKLYSVFKSFLQVERLKQTPEFKSCKLCSIIDIDSFIKYFLKLKISVNSKGRDSIIKLFSTEITTFEQKQN